MSCTGNTVGKLREVVEKLYGFGEVVAGSMAERRLVESVRGMLEERGCSVRLIPVKVLCWEDLGARVEVGNRELEALALPPTMGGGVEGRLVKVECPFAQCFAKVREGDVVLIELPEDPDDVASAYALALEKGASALVVYDRWPSRHRRIVVVGKWSYSPHDPAPALIPAVHLKKEDGVKLALEWLGRRVRVRSRTRIRASTGYIVEAVLEARRAGSRSGDWEVMVTAHHDHWLGGANDNLSGVASLVVLAEVLKEGLEGPGFVRLVSFTAEEYGDPLQPSWYWSYGSRFYAEQMQRAGLLEKVVAVLNLDAAASPKTAVNVTGLELRGLLESLALKLGVRVEEWRLDSPYTDSFSFSRLGVPSASILDINSWVDRYHTDLDMPAYLSYERLVNVIKLVEGACRVLVSEGFQALDYRRYAREVYQTVSSGEHSLEVVRSAYRLLREVEYAISRGDYEGLYKAFKMVNANLVKPLFHGDYKLNNGEFENVLMPQLEVSRKAKRAIKLLRQGKVGEALKLCAEQVIIPWDERLLSMPLRIYSRLPAIQSRVLTTVLEEVLTAYARLLESEVSRLLDEAYMVLLRRRLGLQAP